MVEGNKNIIELKNSEYKIQEIYSINPSEIPLEGIKISKISERELKKISFLKTPKNSVAVCELSPQKWIENCKFNLVLDGIQDPGNMGTIIRLADWFGIQQIVCSRDTVDVYNPKVIQSSMGSFTRVNIIYTDLITFLQNAPQTNVGTDMKGKSIYDFKFPTSINLILGNEGNGMRPETKKTLDKTISIPRFGKRQSTESLNVAMAGGIILGQYFRK